MARQNPILVFATLIFVLLSIAGFLWMNKLIAVNSFEFFSQLDYGSASGVATACACALLFVYLLYMINYPEGELAKDAASSFKGSKAQ